MTPPRHSDRLFVAGQTGSGKSELLNVLFTEFACQKLLVDTKGHEWAIDGVEPVSDPAAIEWREPVIHYVTTTTEVAEIDELFGALEHRYNLVTCVHELGDLCEYNTNRTPKPVNRYLAQGRAKGQGFLGASQIPVDMPKRARTEVQHIYTMVPAIAEDHLKIVCGMVEGVSTRELRAELEEVEATHGQYSFVHWPKGAGAEPTVWGPLPEELRRGSIVRRRGREHGRSAP